VTAEGSPRLAPVAVAWVVFDVGETIVDETRMWHEWADILGVPRFTMAAAVGAVLALGNDHRDAFDLVAPGVDRRAALARTGRLPPARIEPGDLYPDVRDALAALRASGLQVGIVGNQPRATEHALTSMAIDVDLLASSDGWGVAKPDPAFFARLVAETGVPAAEVAYVGDRLDNDVRPALAAGLQAVLVRRGPWSRIQAALTSVPEGTIVVDSLSDLVDVLVPVTRRASRG
jgi:FMN phosphatase YigB (HAD superfamily)